MAKTLASIDLGAELGAGIVVMWGGREGVEADAAKDVRLALDRYKEAVDLCCEHIRERGYPMRIALEPKPNEPRGDIFLPTVGHALAFISELEWPDMVGLNPEFAHETMSGLNFTHGVAQALWHEKLFHIDLNAQRIGKFDQDFRFGSEGIRDAFYLVRLLEDSGWDGMRHFDAHAYRTEDADGVWQFAAGCMRTYLILKDKAERMRHDADIQDALATAKADQLAEPTGPLAAVRAADLRRGCVGRPGIRPRAPRPAGHGAAPRRPLMPLVAGVDSSTSACKIEVRDADSGELVATGRASHPATSPPRSEQHPRDWWTAFEQACAQAGILDRNRPAALAIAGQQHGLVVLDAAGAVVRPAKLWNDSESALDADELVATLGPEAWAKACGSVPVASFTITKLRWLRRCEPEAFARLARVLLPHDWLTAQLTGAFTTDRGDVVGDRMVVTGRGALPRRPARAGGRHGGVGGGAPGGAGARRGGGGVGGGASSARERATTWPPPSGSASVRATSA